MKARIETVLPPGLPPCLHRLTAPCYLHRAAQWKVTALLGLALALVLAGLGYWAVRLPPRGPDAASLAFAAFLLLFLVLLGRRAIWRSPIVVAADRQGLFFVGSTESVLVPWQETGPLTIERARTSAGVSECVVVAIDAKSSFWDAARKSLMPARIPGSERPPGFLRYPLANAGVAPELTRACLEELRRSSGHVDAHPDFSPGPKTRSWELVLAGVFLLGIALSFGAIMIASMLERKEDPSIGLAIPLFMAVLSVRAIRAGWRRRH